MKDIIIMLGPQGSGKSTQAKLLAKKYNYIDIIESNILRKEAKKAFFNLSESEWLLSR